MIPKKIHYCWFGGNPKPRLAEKCLCSWKRYCPDCEIVEWNESNYNISSAPLYVQQAYEAKQWAFVTDYVRLKVVYEHGGVYFDTDVELKRNIDHLLVHKAFFGFENGRNINTGLGFGAEKGCQLLYEIMREYEDIPFIQPNGCFDTMPCPQRNTGVFLKHGLIQDNSKQILREDVLILPKVYLCPIDCSTMRMHYSPKTIAVHWFAASWHTDEQRRAMREKQKQNRRRNITRLLRGVLGNRLYERIREILLRKRQRR